MMSMAFQWLDAAVVLVIIVSTVYAAYRGFVSETLSILAWAAAAFATLWFGPWMAYWLRNMVSPPWLGEVVGYAAVFLVVVIPLSFASFRFSEGVKRSPVSALDRALGAAFGVVRGLVIIGIAYVIFTAMVRIEDQPGWVSKARLLPLIQISAQVITSIIPDQHVGPADRVQEKPQETQVIHDDTRKTAPATAPKHVHKKHHKKTYGAKDRHALDRLIEIHRKRQTMNGLTADFEFDGDTLHEECGVFGVFGHPGAGALTVLGLHALQHRGQEAAGIVTFDKGQFIAERHQGLVGDIFGKNSAHAENLKGSFAIGHNRYSTAGGSASRNIQPLFADLTGGGIAIAHNGNLTNARALRSKLVQEGAIFQSTSDTEVIIHLTARSSFVPIVNKLVDALKQVEGAYSLVALTSKKLIGARDPWGVRPLVLGDAGRRADPGVGDLRARHYWRRLCARCRAGRGDRHHQGRHRLLLSVSAAVKTVLRLRIYLLRTAGFHRGWPQRL